MTIAIHKGILNEFALSYILDKSIYTARTYKFSFIGGSTKETQTLVLVPTVAGNRYSFTLTEGTDITFTNDGFYEWELYEVEDITLNENLLCEGFMKVYNTRTAPTTPTALDGKTYKVFNNG